MWLPLCSFVAVLSLSVEIEQTLKQVQVVLRHGDRTPTKFVPGDKYADLAYWPQGMGQLVNQGKQRLFRKGEFLRKRYDQFLKNPRQVYVRSGITERCLNSASYLMSGLFPPENIWIWSNKTELGKLWQAFPIETMPKDIDYLLEFNTNEIPCPIMDKIFDQIQKSKPYLEDLERLSDFFHFLSSHLKVKINTIKYGKTVAANFLVERENGYLHDWLNDSDYKRLEEVKRVSYQYEFSDPTISKIHSGKLIEELANNMNNSINNSTKGKNFFVYSTHDTEIATMLYSLGVYNNNYPPYVALVIVELHHNSTDDSHFVKLLYHNASDIDFDIECIDVDNPKCQLHSLLQDSECGSYCTFEKFLSSFQHLFYEDRNKECLLQGVESSSPFTLAVKNESIGPALFGVFVGFILASLVFTIAYQFAPKKRRNAFECHLDKNN